MQLSRFLSRRRPTLLNRSLRRAFTMMEILVVLAILGLLVALSVSNLDTIFGGASVSSARLFVRESLKSPLFTYKMQVSDFPSTSEGLQALIVAPPNKVDRWAGPYITETKVPNDPWGEPYQYMYPGQKNKAGYDLWSKGPDKTTGTADDIGNWDTSPATPESK